MKIAIIGCGTMGSAFARHLAHKNSVILSDRDEIKAQDLAQEIGAIAQKNLDLTVREADVVLLAVKPKDLSAIAKAMKSSFSEGKILISILAGVPLSVLKRSFPSVSVVRAMPNLALICGHGVIGLSEDDQLPEEIRKTVGSLLNGLGLHVWMAEEKLEALTALSGSGIGFIFVMIEAMMEAGVYLGFTAHDSKEFVLQTMEGAIALMRKTGKHPAELKLNVSSPGGTTIEGLRVMEEKAVRSGIIHTMIACYEKAHQMMKHVEK
jgi:pyrroline-5-carboxylate reductase